MQPINVGRKVLWRNVKQLINKNIVTFLDLVMFVVFVSIFNFVIC